MNNEPEVIMRKWGDYWTAQILVGNRWRAYSISIADGSMVEILPGANTPFVVPNFLPPTTDKED